MALGLIPTSPHTSGDVAAGIDLAHESAGVVRRLQRLVRVHEHAAGGDDVRVLAGEAGVPIAGGEEHDDDPAATAVAIAAARAWSAALRGPIWMLAAPRAGDDLRG